MTRLAELMEAKGTSARQLAERSGVPERTVYRHAKGEATPNIKQAAAYAKALGVSVDELVGVHA